MLFLQVFDPEYVPAVSIEKPLSHRISVVSNDFLQFLTPFNNSGLHGNKNIAVLLEGSCDDKDVLLHDATSHVKAMETKSLPQEFSGSGIAQAEDLPPDYSSVSHSELTTYHSEVSRYVLENLNTTMNGSSDVLHETEWSASLDEQRRDSSSLHDGLSRNHEVSGTSLDKHYNSSSGGYVDSNLTTLATISKDLDDQPSSSDIFELEMESDGEDSKPHSSISVTKIANATSYVDSALIGAQNTGEETFTDLNLDSSYLYSEDGGVLCIDTQSSPLTLFHDHTTDEYVSNGQIPPTDRRCSSKQDESLELDFLTESDSYSTEGDKDEQCLVSLTFQDQSCRASASFNDLPMPPKNILDVNYLSLPDDSAQSQGYVTCGDISNSEPLTRKTFVPRNLPSSESNPEFVMNLDFDSQTHTNGNPVLLSGSGMKMNTDMPRDQQLLSSDIGAECLPAIAPEGQSSDKDKL